MGTVTTTVQTSNGAAYLSIGLGAMSQSGRTAKVPRPCVETLLKPDVVLASISSKQVLSLELTVSREDRMEGVNERK